MDGCQNLVALDLVTLASKNGTCTRRSPASRRRNRTRHVAWVERCAQRHQAVPLERIWLLDRLVKACLSSHGPFGQFTARFKKLPSSSSRHRDLFPLPLLGLSALDKSELQSWKRKILLSFINLVVLVLNYLHGLSVSASLPSQLNAAQGDVHSRIVARCLQFHSRLVSVGDESWEHLVPDWVPGIVRTDGPRYGEIKAEAIDCLVQAGMCDPLPHLPVSVQGTLMDPSALFENAPNGLDGFAGVAETERLEYVKLVAKQLRCGKLGLSERVKGGGSVLAVSKPGTGKQREVWHGRQVSQAALRPPVPRHLASPSALLHLEASLERPLRVSKRDARCWFDQLSLVPALREWMGRPAVTLDELSSVAGMNSEEVNKGNPHIFTMVSYMYFLSFVIFSSAVNEEQSTSRSKQMTTKRKMFQMMRVWRVWTLKYLKIRLIT